MSNFGVFLGVGMGIRSIQCQREEYMAWKKVVSLCSSHEQAELIRVRKSRERRARDEATEERRHKEVCQAIKEAGFWSFLG